MYQPDGSARRISYTNQLDRSARRICWISFGQSVSSKIDLSVCTLSQLPICQLSNFPHLFLLGLNYVETTFALNTNKIIFLMTHFLPQLVAQVFFLERNNVLNIPNEPEDNLSFIYVYVFPLVYEILQQKGCPCKNS